MGRCWWRARRLHAALREQHQEQRRFYLDMKINDIRKRTARSAKERKEELQREKDQDHNQEEQRRQRRQPATATAKQRTTRRIKKTATKSRQPKITATTERKQIPNTFASGNGNEKKGQMARHQSQEGFKRQLLVHSDRMMVTSFWGWEPWGGPRYVHLTKSLFVSFLSTVWAQLELLASFRRPLGFK